MSYYTDERLITSRDALNRWEFKLKLLDVVENARDPAAFKFGHRVLVKKVLVIIRNLRTNEVTEKELDLEDIENEIRSKRYFSSANRWVAPSEIKNGYIVGYRHNDLLASAIALDYIVI
ncbi:MAG: hypothetical protein RMJ59_04135 [Candidatus Nitrosocaldus sp.]|nr:hypothetical protein [Candidatus Nitrosocaldus sp.]MCS7141133.1 hypothetical protein [Candidatus Nitrosocaldus sp.]MDW8000097.1 hypothetical protein [Candidatus Nitrosocaldus sp.]MDW8275555.1 hypothetical protein [Candidatus Nitrosocaldus sp.]